MGNEINQAVYDHLFVINMKQMAPPPPRAPVNMIFDQPLFQCQGRLMARVLTESYKPPPSGVVNDNPYGCLNTEIHATVGFGEEAATSYR